MSNLVDYNFYDFFDDIREEFIDKLILSDIEKIDIFFDKFQTIHIVCTDVYGKVVDLSPIQY